MPDSDSEAITGRPPSLRAAKLVDEPSVFTPETVLREARRQKNLPDRSVPAVCLLDPDGDVVEHLCSTGQATRDEAWPGYHTDLYRFEHEGETVGVVPHAVGGPFAVLVAEQLFAAGCEFLVSVTSSGQVAPRGEPPYVVLVDRALRDEGTSHHYLPPDDPARLAPGLCEAVEQACAARSVRVDTGTAWTTDAPFRETERAVARAREAGALAVEMEAAALYGFAAARDRPVVCFAQVTNEMGRGEAEFEKGESAGSVAALAVLGAAVEAWRSETG